MSTSIGEFTGFMGSEHRGLSRPEPDREVLRLTHPVLLWLGGVLS